MSDPPSQGNDDSEQDMTAMQLVFASLTELIRAHREVLEQLRRMEDRIQHLGRRPGVNPPVLEKCETAELNPPGQPSPDVEVNEELLLRDLGKLVRSSHTTPEH